MAQPSVAVDANEFPTHVVVELRDAFGARSDSSGVEVSIALATGNGALAGSSRAYTVRGEARFSGLIYYGIGEMRLRASATGAVSAQSTPIRIAGRTVVVDSARARIVSDSAALAAGRIEFDGTNVLTAHDSGKVLVAAVGSGYLRRILEVRQGPTTTVVETAPASISDAGITAIVRDSSELDIAGALVRAGVVRPHAAAASPQVGPYLANSGNVLLPTVAISTPLFTARLDNVQIAFATPALSRDWLFESGVLRHFNTSLRGAIELSGELTITSSLDHDLVRECRAVLPGIPPIALPTVYVPTPLGLVLPVLSDLVLTLDLCATMTAEGSVSLSAPFSVVSQFGVEARYSEEEGLAVIPLHTQQVSGGPMAHSGQVDAEAVVELEGAATVRVYSVAGPRFVLIPGLEAELHASAEPPQLVSRGTAFLSVGVGLQFDMLDFYSVAINYGPARVYERELWFHEAEITTKQRLTVAGTGSGTVTSSPPALNCILTGGIASGECDADFARGTTVRLSATPAPGHDFHSWSGDCASTTPTCEIAMTQSRSALVAFVPRPPPPPLAIASIAPTQPQQVSMNGTLTYRITVHDGTGLPLAGVVVVGEDPASQRNVLTEPTDAAGVTTYVVSATANPGTYDVSFRATKAGYTASAPVHRSVTVVQPSTPKLVLESVAPVEPRVVLVGDVIAYTIVVRDQHGAPVAGAMVGGEDPVSLRSFLVGPTNAVGITHYTVNAAASPGTYKVHFTAMKDGYAPSATVERTVTVQAPPVQQKLTIVSLTPTAAQVVVAEAHVNYTIVVWDQTGAPVNGALIQGEDPVSLRSFQAGPTNADGSATYTVNAAAPPGEYTVTFKATKNGYAASAVVGRSVTVINGSISARIDNWNGTTTSVPFGQAATVGYRFTNTSSSPWTFGAGASLRRPDGTEVDLPLQSVTVGANGSATVEWFLGPGEALGETYDVLGKWDLRVRVWKEPATPLVHSLDDSGWRLDYITVYHDAVRLPSQSPVYQPVSGTQGGSRLFVVHVPPGKSILQVSLGGGSGNADLYIRYGYPPIVHPTPGVSRFDCKSTAPAGELDVCSRGTPAPGDWYIQVVGATSYSGWTLAVTYD